MMGFVVEYGYDIDRYVIVFRHFFLSVFVIDFVIWYNGMVLIVILN